MESGSVVLDWGTTNLRAYLVAADGSVQARLKSNSGVRSLLGGQFERVFRDSCGGWLTPDRHVPVFAVGMIGSRNGWLEAPYVNCPARVEEVACALVDLRLADGLEIHFVPGLSDRRARPFADVMRGEETQLFGFGCDRDMCIVMPGTHSKWARVGAGTVHGFGTFVTGEIFDLLSRHSFVAGMLTQGPSSDASADWAAFEHGIEAALECGRANGGQNAIQSRLLSSLFSVRTGFLAGKLDSASAGDYLSGLLVCSEFIEARGRWFEHGDDIGIISGERLFKRYHRVASRFGLRAQQGSSDTVVAGVRAIQAAAGKA